MPVESQVPSDHPMMIAWESYKTSEDYANTRKWAQHEQHVNGSLWAAFVEGWKRSAPAHPTEPGEEQVAVAICRSRGYDPYEIVSQGSLKTVRNLGVPGRSMASVADVIAFPRWHKYRVEARAVCAALSTPSPAQPKGETE
jgi:hypothetical protein